MNQRIAIATSDGTTLSDHLARASAFHVVEVSEGRIVSSSVRARGTDGCGRHATFTELLEGCDAVLCGGIGEGAARALAAHGIQPVVAAGGHTVEEALRLHLAGTLATTTERVCLCGGH